MKYEPLQDGAATALTREERNAVYAAGFGRGDPPQRATGSDIARNRIDGVARTSCRSVVSTLSAARLGGSTDPFQRNEIDWF
jgi:hypothetical protein